MHNCQCQHVTMIIMEAPGPFRCSHCDGSMQLDTFDLPRSLQDALHEWVACYGTWLGDKIDGMTKEIAHNIRGKGLAGEMAKQFPQLDFSFSPSTQMLTIVKHQETSCYAYFELIGNDDFSLCDVTNRLQVTPTNTWKLGEVMPQDPSRTYFCTRWTYEVGPFYTLYVNDVLMPLYAIFNDKVEVLNALQKQYGLSVQIVVVLQVEKGQTPTFTISSAFSCFVSRVHAILDVDLYVELFHEDDGH